MDVVYDTIPIRGWGGQTYEAEVEVNEHGRGMG